MYDGNFSGDVGESWILYLPSTTNIDLEQLYKKQPGDKDHSQRTDAGIEERIVVHLAATAPEIPAFSMRVEVPYLFFSSFLLEWIFKRISLTTTQAH